MVDWILGPICPTPGDESIANEFLDFAGMGLVDQIANVTTVLEIYRPAMFKRFGLTIIGEHVTLDRSNGQFKQWIDLEGEKRLDLITGHCKRTTDAPF